MRSLAPSPRYDSREAFSPVPIAPSEASPLYNMPGASSSSSSLPGNNARSPPDIQKPTSSPTDGSYEKEAERAYRAHMASNALQVTGVNDNVIPQIELPAHRPAEYLDILEDLKDNGPEELLAKSWAIDPHEEDPEWTVHLVEKYFTYVNDGLYYIFPRSRFIMWLKSCRTKSAEDRMLLYSMMALGSLFSDQADRAGALRRYTHVARFASQKSQHVFSLQLAQTHLILSLLYYGVGSLVACWDSLGAAGRVVSALRYNLESGGVVTELNQVCDYGLHPQALVECRRRTFWVTYILDVSDTVKKNG